MPVEQLYVLEMIVKRIVLESDIEIEDINGLTIAFKFVKFMNFDIDTAFFSSPKIEDNSGGKVIKMNYGKTFLFIARPSALRQLLQTDPYHITLYDGNKTIGSTAIHWKKEFSEMVRFFESLGIVKSTTVEETWKLYSNKGILTAKIDSFLRLSCFGQNLQTMFQINTEGPKEEYIFRQRNESKTFVVEKHADERCQPIVAPLYSGITDVKDKPVSQINIKENVSLTQLFERDYVNAKDSTYHPPEGDGDEGELKKFQEGSRALLGALGLRVALQEDFDKVSICFRPSENKFFDLLNLISADVKTDNRQTEITIQKKKVPRVTSFLKSVGGNLRSSRNIVIDEDEEEIKELTAEKIAKKLCKSKDCPAVKKFKEYGIGPLATGKGLGTVYGDVEPPVTYGISHTYGTLCEYGPYGVFSRPKQEELPFVPLKDEDVPVKPCKLKREVSDTSDKNKKKKNKKKTSSEWHSQSCPRCQDRLRGGADDVALTQKQKATEDETVMPKSPMMECKSVMDQFDNILAEYKKALGPCGHATCPYAQTLAEETCKKMCEQPLPPAKEGSATSCTEDATCDVDACPYKADPKIKRYPAGCGSPKCAYTKYKLGLVDDDAELELKFLPPALGDNCVDPHCKYPLAAPLPPIHWECPDPLPKGPCRNLNCPFQPRPLKKFITKKQLKTGPCGSPMCPYALPQPCGAPNCPFVMVPCPMTHQQEQGQPSKKKECPPKEGENLCENPDCPFAEANAKRELADDPGDPKFKGEFQDCVNPDCPYKKKKKKKDKKKKSKKIKEISGCGNPNCPAIHQKKKKKRDKDNEEESSSICSNPECPDRSKKKDKDDKNSCLKSSSSASVTVCSDPECPYVGLKNKKKKRGRGDGDESSTTVSCSQRDDDSICSNPSCPERAARDLDDQDICDLPGCPYSKKPPKSTKCNDPTCPYLKPLPSCGIPNCPYEPMPLRFSCKNPKCPSKFLNFSTKAGKSKLGASGEASQRETRGSARAKSAKICEVAAPCDVPAECDNPECDMPQDESGGKGETSQHRELVAIQSKQKKCRRKKKGKFVYSIGDSYPITKLGHRECVTPMFNVPPHMGWLWNIFTPILSLKPRRGWRPGAITRTIAARIRAHRQSKGLGYLRVPSFRKDGGEFDENDPKVVPKPTLQIQKKEGTYWITMNPLKDPNALVENEDPYMDCTPMTFKITKNKKPTDDLCYCDCDEIPEDMMSSSSSDSELDIEFTPPAGIIHPERFKKRPNVICCEAQYDPKDFEVIKKIKEEKKGAKGKGKGDEKGGNKKGGNKKGGDKKGGKKGKKK